MFFWSKFAELQLCGALISYCTQSHTHTHNTYTHTSCLGGVYAHNHTHNTHTCTRNRSGKHNKRTLTHTHTHTHHTRKLTVRHVILQLKMLTSRHDADLEHKYSSGPFEWPLFDRNVAYWLSANSNVSATDWACSIRELME